MIILKKIIFSIFLMSIACVSFSVTNEQPEDMKQMAKELRKVKLEAQALREEMMSLRAEMHKMKQETEKQKQFNVRIARASKKSTSKDNLSEEFQITTLPTQEDSLLSRYTRFPSVTTSPYLGLQSAYDGSDLLVNVSSMGEDLRLLRQRQALSKKLGGDLAIFENRPVLIVSGKLEPTVWGRRISEDRRNRSDIDLDCTELDFLAEASSNAFGFISLGYDNQGLDRSLVNSPIGRRISNSRVFLKRGFITLGNLDKTPFYLSAGQMFTDFGRYSSNMISSTMPSKISRTNARQVQLGYVLPIGLSASAFVFKGDTHTGYQNKINEGGVNLRFKKEFNNSTLEFGSGYISNVADSEQMQVTGLSFPRQGFAFTREFLFHKVPAVDAYGSFKLGSWKFISEYVSVTRSFDFRNLTFNHMGAKPRALQLELAKDFTLFNKPSLIGFSYDRSWEAYALGLTKDSFGVVFSTVPLKNIRFSLEYRYGNEYRKGTTAYISGSPFFGIRTPFPFIGIPSFVPRITPVIPGASPLFIIDPSRSCGGHRSGVIAQLGLYF